MKVTTQDAELEDETGLLIAAIVDTNELAWVGIQVKTARISLHPDHARQVARALLTAADDVDELRTQHRRYDA